MHRMGHMGLRWVAVSLSGFWGAELVAGEEIGAREHGGVAGEGSRLTEV